jgi:hypothetical protein
MHSCYNVTTPQFSHSLSSHGVLLNIFTKFRISDHSLEIEKGRYNKTPCEERLCGNCGVVTL